MISLCFCFLGKASKTISAMSMQHFGNRCHAAGPGGKHALMIIGKPYKGIAEVVVMLPRDTALPTHAGHAAPTTTAQLTEGIGTVLGLLHLRRRLRLVPQRSQRARVPPPPPPPPAPRPSCGVRHWEPLPHDVCFAPGAPASGADLFESTCPPGLRPVSSGAVAHTHMAGPTVEPHSGVGSPGETPAALGGRGWLRCAVRVLPRVAKL